MLGDYAVHGAVLRRYSRSLSRLAGDGADTVARFQAWLRTAGRAVSTVRTYGTVAGEFVAFLDTRGGMAGCDVGAVEAFVATFAGYQFKTVEQKLCALQSFLRFASGDGLIDTAVLDTVPAVKSRKADFSGRRNNRSFCGREKHSEMVRRSDPIQGLSWPGVELGGDGGEFVWSVPDFVDSRLSLDFRTFKGPKHRITVSENEKGI